MANVAPRQYRCGSSIIVASSHCFRTVGPITGRDRESLCDVLSLQRDPPSHEETAAEDDFSKKTLSLQVCMGL